MYQAVRGRSRVIAVVAIAALVANACGSSATAAPSQAAGASAPASGAPAAASVTPAASSAASAAAGPSGTLSIAYRSDVQSFDPAIAYDVVSWPIMILIFDRLLTFDANAKILPELADGMPTVSADGKAYTFKIHAGTQFVKVDGSVLREVTADDVAYSLNRVLDPNLKPTPSPVATSFFGNIVGAADVIAGKAKTASGIKVIDPTTVEIDLVRSDATILDVLATPFGSIVPKELATEDTAAFSKAPVGSGAFYLKAYTKGQQATMARNTHYWQAGTPHVDEIDIRVGVDDNSALQQLEAGSLDILGDQIPSGSFTATVNNPQYTAQVQHYTQNSVLYMFMDTSAPAGSPGAPLANVKVRQALNAAIDKQNILKIIHGTGVEATCILPPGMPGYDPTCKPYTYDPAAAKAALAAAGYPNGFPQKLKLYTDTTDPDPAIGQALQQDLAQVGVQVDVVSQQFDTFLNTIETPHKAQIGYVGWFQDYPDPSDFVDPILSCATAVQGGANAAFYCNKQVDVQAAAAKGELDPQKRLADYQAVQKAIMADAPWVPIFHQDWYTMISPRVQGFSLHPVWTYDMRSFAVTGQ
jgi:peptide/nickel transport system substrate-binding protein/oligopeptide transport system substrate-binding protein